MGGTLHLNEVLFIVLAIIALIQICIYWLIYRRLAFYKPKQVVSDIKPVSVIICARNESVRLRKYLPEILEQDYPSFEVVVVNDCSWDETESYLEDLNKKYPHLKVVTIKEQEKYRHGKKFALTLGIKAATYDTLLLTDADCVPASRNWISLMQKNYSAGTELVIGFGPYLKTTGILNMLIRFDSFFSAIQYLSAAIGRNTYMGVGRNLSYTKGVFFRSKGFAKHNHVLSGDDDLFVNENATPTNTAVELDPESFTYSEPKKSFSDWFVQKRRHMSTARLYKFSHRFALAVQNLSSFVFNTLLIALIVLRYDWRLLLSLYVLVLIVRFPIVYKASVKLKEKDLAWAFPVLEIIHSILQPVFFTSNLLTKQKTWK